jgi:hypothetical protein
LFDFFGDEGVQAVNQAFDILNDLPTASQLDLQTFGTDTRRVDFRAVTTNLIDLRSTVLSLVVEQLGLASPERYVWTLRDRKIFSSGQQTVTNYLVINRNFDPATYDQSEFVNSNRYSYQVLEFQNSIWYADAVETVIDPADIVRSISAVPSFATNPGSLAAGVLLTGLTQDDAGGLRYLLHPLNINYEPLPEDVILANDATNSGAIVREALRPGVGKLQFVFVGGAWETTPNWTMDLEWTDNYYLNGDLKQQRLKRVQTRPNIVISVADLGTDGNNIRQPFSREACRIGGGPVAFQARAQASSKAGSRSLSRNSVFLTSMDSPATQPKQAESPCSRFRAGVRLTL